VIPTLLIGIVSIKYDESMRYQEKSKSIAVEMNRIKDNAELARIKDTGDLVSFLENSVGSFSRNALEVFFLFGQMFKAIDIL